MIKCVILEDENNEQCIIGMDFLAHPDIHVILNFKDNYIEIQDDKLPLKDYCTKLVSIHPFLIKRRQPLLNALPTMLSLLRAACSSSFPNKTS
uniref:Uncharacterized protein n=1 Tax=Romanomermis culicivorax TaxID=13658 RepID=A0A915HSQ7_ROMCU